MVSIRRELPQDIDSIRYVNEQAFGRKQEAILVDRLRNRGVVTLSLVALMQEQVVGHILFSPVTIRSGISSFQAITLAPLAVLPAYQRKAIGSQLVRTSIDECKQLGHEIILLVGHPEYYPRFGFVPARHKGIECEFDAPDEAWMILEIKKGALAGRKGTATFQPEFREAI